MKKDLLDITCFITSSQSRTVTSSVSKLIKLYSSFSVKWSVLLDERLVIIYCPERQDSLTRSKKAKGVEQSRKVETKKSVRSETLN